jgi:hypothetical protein
MWAVLNRPAEIEVQSDDVAQIWKDAHVQRAEDLSTWLKQFFRRRSDAHRPEVALGPPGRILVAR